MGKLRESVSTMLKRFDARWEDRRKRSEQLREDKRAADREQADQASKRPTWTPNRAFRRAYLTRRKMVRRRRPLEVMKTSYEVTDRGRVVMVGRSRAERRELGIGRPRPLVKTRSN
jgi:hypothetical protein